MIPQTTILELFSNSLVLGLLSAHAVSTLFDIPLLLFFVLHTFLWFTLDVILATSVQNGAINYSWCDIVAVWLFAEALAIPIRVRKGDKHLFQSEFN